MSSHERQAPIPDRFLQQRSKGLHSSITVFKPHYRDYDDRTVSFSPRLL